MRPYQDGCWSALPSGALVWFDGGLPTKVRWRGRPAWEGKPKGRLEELEEELGRLTGERFRLAYVQPIEDGWIARVLQ